MNKEWLLSRAELRKRFAAVCVDRDFAAQFIELVLLAILAFGIAAGVLLNSFLLEFSAAFVGSLLIILTIAGLVWCALTLHIVLFYPFIKSFKLEKKKTFVQQYDVTPIHAEMAAPDEIAEKTWIGVATLSVVASLWLLLVGWAIIIASNSFIVFSGWGAFGCSAAASGLSIIAGAYDNDDVRTLAFVVAIAGALFTTLLFIGLLAI
jgi:hypothetical protein